MLCYNGAVNNNNLQRKEQKDYAKNLDIREAAQNNAVMLWEIAEKIGMADSSFSRKLRHELPQSEKERIFTAIEEIAKEKAVD